MVFTTNATAENVLATMGAIMWSVQILPQIWKSYRTKSTKGLSAYLMLIWFLASLFMGAYLVVQRLSIPLQIQPQAFGLFSAVSYCQCLHYGQGCSKWKAGAVLLGLCAGFAGFEAGSVYALWLRGIKAGEDRGVVWPTLMYGYIGAVLLALGLAPQYWEIYKLRQVIGISLLFLAVDILGGVLSFLSLFFRDDLDIAAFVSYALVCVLDGIVIILAWILNPIARRKARARQSEHRLAPAPARSRSRSHSHPPSHSGQTDGGVPIDDQTSRNSAHVTEAQRRCSQWGCSCDVPNSRSSDTSDEQEKRVKIDSGRSERGESGSSLARVLSAGGSAHGQYVWHADERGQGEGDWETRQAGGFKKYCVTRTQAAEGGCSRGCRHGLPRGGEEREVNGKKNDAVQEVPSAVLG